MTSKAISYKAKKHIINYYNWEELQQMNDDEKVLVSRILINTKIASLQLKQSLSEQENETYSVLIHAQNEILNNDIQEFNGHEIFVTTFGAELSVAQVKKIFSQKDIDRGCDIRPVKHNRNQLEGIQNFKTEEYILS